MEAQPGADIPAQVPRHVGDWGDIRHPIRVRRRFFAVSLLFFAGGIAAPLVLYALGVRGQPFLITLLVGCGLAGALGAIWMWLIRRDVHLREVCRWGLIVGGQIDDLDLPPEEGDARVSFHYQALSGEVRHARWKVQRSIAEELAPDLVLEALIDADQPGLVCVPRLQGVRFEPVSDRRPERFVTEPVFKAPSNAVLSDAIRIDLHVRPAIHARRESSLELVGELRLDPKGIWLKHTHGVASTQFIAWDTLRPPELSVWLLDDDWAELNVSLSSEGALMGRALSFGTRLPQRAFLREITLVQDAVPFVRSEDFRLLWPIVVSQMRQRQVEVPNNISLDEFG